MDKFGIFNLLSSLFSATQTQNGENPNGENTAFSSATQITDNVAAEKRANLPPLKNSMLSTMKNHDEFYKRVMDGQSKQK